MSHVLVAGATPFQAVGCYSTQAGNLITEEDFKIIFNLYSIPSPSGGYVVYAGLKIPQAKIIETV